MRGFFYTIKSGNSRIFLNAKSTTGAFFAEITVAEFREDEHTFDRLTLKERYNMLMGKQVIIDYGRGRAIAARNVDLANIKGRTKSIFRLGQKTTDETMVEITKTKGDI